MGLIPDAELVSFELVALTTADSIGGKGDLRPLYFR